VNNFNILNADYQITNKCIDYLSLKIGAKRKKQLRSFMVFHVEGLIDFGSVDKAGIIEQINSAINNTDQLDDW
jgi:hypothetical protein